MPKVIYKGTGSTGQSVPVDSTDYAANGSFTVAGSGDLTLGSSLFFCWTTKADGRRTPFGPGRSTFPNRSTNLSLANSANAVAAGADRIPVRQTSADTQSTAELLLKIPRSDGLSLVTSPSKTFDGIT
jgi:hypothetical protein